MTLGMAEKVNASSAGDNSACSDGESRENECGSSEGARAKARTRCRGFS